MRCPLDGAELVQDGLEYRDNRMGLPHAVRIAWCPVCDLGVTVDPPDDLAALYEQHYAAEEGRVPRTHGAGRLWHRLNGSLPLTDLVRVGPVLDVGSHTGEALVALRRRGFEVTGLEPNPQAAEVARREGIDVIEAPIEEAELPGARYGSILLSQVLEHVRDPHDVLRKVRPALRPGGTIYIVVPNAHSVWRRVFEVDWIHWHVPFHLFHFNEQALRTLCAQCDLDVTVVDNVTPGEWLLMSMEAQRNRQRGRYELEPWSGRYGRRLLVAPAGRIGDALHRGDAIVAQAVSSR